MKGGIAIETVLVLALIVLPLMAFFMDLIRLSQNQAVLHHMCFLFTRYQALGVGRQEALEKAISFFDGALSFAELRSLKRATVAETELLSDGVWGTVRYRFVGLFPFWHRRFQVTKRCHFWS